MLNLNKLTKNLKFDNVDEIVGGAKVKLIRRCGGGHSNASSSSSSSCSSSSSTCNHGTATGNNGNSGD